MPYINPASRDRFDECIFDLAEEIESPGELSYVIFKLLLGVAYNSEADFTVFNALVGVLETTKHEFQRRVVTPYEESKREANGDVFEEEDADGNMRFTRDGDT